MGRVTSLQQRLEIVERAARGQSDRQIGEQMDLSAETVRKWRRKGQRQGRAGLVVRQGRPPSGVLSTSPAEVRQAIELLQQAHPRWGPDTVRQELAGQPQLADQPLPSRSRLAAFRAEAGVTRPYEHHTRLQQPVPQEAQAPHEEWEMDAQGVQVVTGVGQVVVINLLDWYTQLKVDSLGCVGVSKAGTADYQLACRRAFMRYGLPQRLSLDHDSVFFDNTCPSPYPTRLHLWLMALGLEVRFIDQPPPQQHSRIEHTHTLISQQALQEQAFADPPAMQHQLDARRDFLNTTYPSRTWHGRAPLQAHPSAQHSGRFYSPATEVSQLDLNRVYAYLAQHRWFRQTSAKGQFFLGRYRYGLGQIWAKQTLDLTFDPDTVELICTSADGRQTVRLPAQGLTRPDLMGELPAPDQFPPYQLRLPLCPASCREATLFQEMAGTTL